VISQIFQLVIVCLGLLAIILPMFIILYKVSVIKSHCNLITEKKYIHGKLYVKFNPDPDDPNCAKLIKRLKNG
jgi:hypothetical protein